MESQPLSLEFKNNPIYRRQTYKILARIKKGGLTNPVYQHEEAINYKQSN